VASPAGEDRRPRVALFGVDAFTDRPFGGNPAMVCLLPGPASDEWMQRAAAELNQPATAFLHDRRLRWFTPSARRQEGLVWIEFAPVTVQETAVPGGDDADFTSRNFAPGLDEDQATGSTHAVLGPLWAGRLGRRRLSALQASVRRGRPAVAVEDDRVHVGGHAIIITRGEWVP
jgi:predicted PhzF superfamily epimerase YddE/YHI9